MDDRAADDFIDEEPEYGVEWNLPLGAENFRTGEPLVVVDYFDLVSLDGAATSEKLLGLDGAMPDDGGPAARILIFGQRSDDEPLDVRDLIAIATVRGATLRVETARLEIAEPVCEAVQDVLGPGAHHRVRTRENPVEVYLNAP